MRAGRFGQLASLFCALAIIYPSHAAQSVLTPVPGSERSWDVTCDLPVPEFAQGEASEFVITLPARSATTYIKPGSVAVSAPAGQPKTQPVAATLEGADSQASRPLVLRGPGVQSGAVLRVSFTTRVWNTRIDEPLARARPWPEASWPSDVMPYLQPDEMVESDLLSIRAFVTAITGDQPRARPPYDLAKQIAAAAIDHCRKAPSRNSDRASPHFQGLKRIVMARAADDQELPVFLCALYRAAGLPARVIQGVDVGEADSGNKFLPCRRTWVEFLLPGADEGSEHEWIPVDIVRQREATSRAPSLVHPWPWFGNNMETNYVIPYSSYPRASAVAPRTSTRELWVDCPTCPDRRQPARSDNVRGVEIRPAVQRPGR